MTAGAAELGEAIRRGERSPVKVVDEQIAMIESHDPQLNAVVVHRFDEAREEDRRAARSFTLCTAANALGLPSASVPAGRNEDGLPLAVQVMAARGRDLDVLAVAAELEKELGGALDPAESPRSALSRPA